jgi:exopolysaccharide biosynthesis polyprenyl glycosylphosphotransferase
VTAQSKSPGTEATHGVASRPADDGPEPISFLGPELSADASGLKSPWIREGAANLRARRRDALYRRALALSDVASAQLAVVLAVVVVGNGRLALALFAAAPIVVLVNKAVGLYDRDEHLLRKTTLDEFPALFQAATFYALVVWLLEDQLISSPIEHGEWIALWSLLISLMSTSRVLARRAVRAVAPTERCLVIGNATEAERLARKINAGRHVDAVVLGRIPMLGRRSGEEGPADGRRWSATPNGHETVPVLGAIGDLGSIIAKHQADRVIIAAHTSDSDHILDAIRISKALGARVSILPRLFEVVGSSVDFDEVEGAMLLAARDNRLSRSSYLLKRSMDVSVAVLGVLLLAPLLVLVAIMIRLDSPGPVFFRQRRIGQGGREFHIVKFRTMCLDADDRKPELRELNEAEGVFKITNDPRVTRVGRVLRRTCIDELPQLRNVLRGEMSLVGPRPLVPEEDRSIEGWYRKRLQFQPGMTGPWQILGSARIPLHEMVKIDYLYGANWSLWLDAKILLRTALYVVREGGR